MVDLVKEVKKAVLRKHRHSQAIEEMNRIASELSEKVKDLLVQRAYEICPYEIGTVLRLKKGYYKGYKYAYVRGIRASEKDGYDLQVVPLTTKLKRHKRFGISSCYLWSWELSRWQVHRTGWYMPAIGEREHEADEKARAAQAEAIARRERHGEDVYHHQED